MTHVKFNGKPGVLNLMDEIMSGFPVLFDESPITGGRNNAPVNIRETNDGYFLDMIAPGFEKSDFKVNLENNLLTISAEREEKQLKEGEKQVRKEFIWQSFKRSFTLDEKIDATGIEASYVNGVLTLNLPKKAEVKQAAREIVIK